MARFDGKHFRGKIGNTSYRVCRNQQLVSGASTKTEFLRTEPMDRSSYLFGKVSTLNSYIRMYMSPLVDKFHDGEMLGRLNSSTNLAMNAVFNEEQLTFSFTPDTFNRLAGFEFNIKSRVADVFLAHLAVTYTEGNVSILIPELTISKQIEFPSASTKCRIIFSRTHLDLETGYGQDSELKYISVVKDKKLDLIPAQTVEFTTEPGCLCIIGIGFNFYKDSFIGEVMTNSKEFNPVAILSAHMTNGIHVLPVEGNWASMHNVKGTIATFKSSQ
ncbi:MAG: hypothetical protein EOO43_07500 [Flavobacterium sp.]|nr:MAG: hypothetical protein EOO43_07500 [Flavobacterium sp.]